MATITSSGETISDFYCKQKGETMKKEELKCIFSVDTNCLMQSDRWIHDITCDGIEDKKRCPFWKKVKQ
jgi:hypothetical protein